MEVSLVISVLLSSLLLCMSMVMVDCLAISNKSDRRTLLAFKAEITQDPLGTLGSWNDDSLHFCKWKGVTCSHRRVTVLDLQSQRLVGSISPHIGNLSFLKVLILHNNSFNGEIPRQVGRLLRLETLSLAHNSLSGRIPKDLENLSALWSLDLSFNNLEGEVPKDGVFMRKLMVYEPKKRRKSRSFFVRVMIITEIAVFCLTFIIWCFYRMIRNKKSKTKAPWSTTSDIGNQFLRVSYNELLKATNGFGSTNLLGMGSFGTVYKGILRQDEKPVAVKVLNLYQRGAPKSFMAECDALSKVRHRNLLKIITCCSSTDAQGNDFKALIFEFMANGSLENWLHPTYDQLERRNLSLEQRLNIAIDVAAALGYLHHHCQTSMVHRDLKPSNVLLDDDLTAHVGDFGLAKFLANPYSSYSGKIDPTNSVAIKGTIGYIAPEYGMGGSVSTRGDVYSFGILLLEMFTGRRPTDDIFKDGLCLHNFCKMALRKQVLKIVDSRLLLETTDGGDHEEQVEFNHNVGNGRRRLIRSDKMREILASIIRIGVVCSSVLPSDRISMNEVIVNLQVVKILFLKERII